MRIPVFRAIWLASLASYVGTWMHLVAVTWLMTTLTSSAALIALVQTAIALPTFLLALPGGALADVVDRRRMIIATQAWQLVVAAALGAITLAGVATPGLVLALTLALGVGAALGLPVFWTITPEIVGQAELPAALALNSGGFTLAQAVGPALGGLLVAAVGAGTVFLLNACSFLGVVVVVAAWRRTPTVSTLPPEHVGGAVRGAAVREERARSAGRAVPPGGSRPLLQRPAGAAGGGHADPARLGGGGLRRAVRMLRGRRGDRRPAPGSSPRMRVHGPAAGPRRCHPGRGVRGGGDAAVGRSARAIMVLEGVGRSW